MGNLFQDAISIYAALRAKKDQEGLNEAEMSEFNRLDKHLTASQEQFTEYTGGGEQLNAPEYVTTPKAVTRDIDFSGQDTPDLTIDAKAYGGRIGAFNGGIQGLMPQQGFMPQPGLMPQQGLNPRMGYANAGEVENFNWGGPDVIEWASAREKGMANDPLLASKIMKLEGEHERDVSEHEGAALFDKAWDLVNRGVAENINHALQMLRGEIDETIDETMFAQGGRIGYDKGTHPLDGVAIEMFGMTFEKLNSLQQIVVNQKLKAEELEPQTAILVLI